uniref:Uncharacterized protein n=1 Tax=Anguilla anguilla TaxID=7936 RepID=A0A0E9QJR9_ANGAN
MKQQFLELQNVQFFYFSVTSVHIYVADLD